MIRFRYGTLSLAALSLTALGLVAVPQGAFAQDPKGDTDTNATDLKNKPIDLDVESANLYYALNLLFQHIKANFQLDPSLKQLEVTAHFHNVPFQVALETLLKSSGQPLTYRFENNIYTVVPKKEETDTKEGIPEKTETEKPTNYHLPIKIRSDQLLYNAVDIVTFLGGKVLNTQNPAGQNGGGLGGGGLGGGGLGGFGGGGLGGGLGGGFGGGGLGGFGGGGGGGFGGGGFGGGGGGLGGGGFGGGGRGGGGLGGGGGGFGGGGRGGF